MRAIVRIFYAALRSDTAEVLSCMAILIGTPADKKTVHE